MIPLIVVLGPTAAGKSEVAVNLALELGGEVISADSMQVYRYFNVGTGKLTPEEQKGIPHHLIDVVDPAIKTGIVAETTAKKIKLRGFITNCYSSC